MTRKEDRWQKWMKKYKTDNDLCCLIGGVMVFNLKLLND